jgi:fibro-slime domain-containing protein
MVLRLAARLSLALGAVILASACGGADDDATNGLGRGASTSKNTGGTGGTAIITVTGGTSGSSNPGGGGTGNTTASGGTGPYMLPAGYTKADNGGWLLGEPVKEGEPPPTVSTQGTMGCGQEILGIVRDFKRGDKTGGHPDFETYQGSGQPDAVATTLGKDQKPVFNPDALSVNGCTEDANKDKPHSCFTSTDDFNEWYNDDASVNDPYYVFFSLEPQGNKATFHSSNFFPLDDKGFGNQGVDHNFGFTTEVHTTFLYNGGETFSFTGDDDLWVFINKKLAIDLGGLHSQQSATVDLDQDAQKLGIKKGTAYPLDLFHAERHTSASNFKIDTNLYFVDCGVIVPSGPVR